MTRACPRFRPGLQEVTPRAEARKDSYSSWASMTTLMAFSVNLSNMALVTTLPFLPLLGLVVALTAKEFPKKADEAFAFLTEEVALDLNGLVLDMTVVLVAALLAAAHATDLFPCTDFIAALAFIFPFLTSRPTRYKLAARRVAFLFSVRYDRRSLLNCRPRLALVWVDA